MKMILKHNLEESKELINKLLSDEALLKNFEAVVEKVLTRLKQGGKIIFLGNGGSMAQAKHLAGELAGKYLIEREALPGIALDSEVILTAVANDYNFDYSFERMIEAYCTDKDVVIGLTTSGNSKNVIAALRKAKEMGCFAVAFTGRDGGKIKGVADICLIVPSYSTPRIQEIHLLLGHTLCELVEKQLFEK